MQPIIHPTTVLLKFELKYLVRKKSPSWNDIPATKKLDIDDNFAIYRDWVVFVHRCYRSLLPCSWQHFRLNLAIEDIRLEGESHGNYLGSL